MWNDSVAGGISSCLYPNCDQKTVNGAGTATTAANTTTTQSCGREAYGSCTTGQKEHSARWMLRVLATKLTLTCQINSISKERGRERRGGRRTRQQLSWVPLDGDKDSTERDSDSPLRSDLRRRRQPFEVHVSLTTVTKLSCWCCLSIHASHTHTHRQTDRHASTGCYTLPPHCFERYVNETVAVSWHNINYPIKIEWVINCPSLPVLITLAEKGHFREEKKKKKEREERKKDGMKRYQTKT